MSEEQDVRTGAGRVRSDGELVRAVRAGRLGAFEMLVKRYQRRATMVAYRFLNNSDEAMEIVQEGFLKAYDKLDSLSRPERFGSWFLRIVANTALNYRRSRALRRTVSLDSRDGEGQEVRMNRPDRRAVSPEQGVLGDELQHRINDALDELPEMQRAALVLFSIEKLPQKDVADILDCSIEAVKWYVFTARRELKDKLKEYM